MAHSTQVSFRHPITGREMTFRYSEGEGLKGFAKEIEQRIISEVTTHVEQPLDTPESED